MAQRVVVGGIVEVVDADKAVGPDGEPVKVGALYSGAAVSDGEAGVWTMTPSGVDRNGAGGIAPEHGTVCWAVAVGFTVVFHCNVVLEKGYWMKLGRKVTVRRAGLFSLKRVIRPARRRYRRHLSVRSFCAAAGRCI